MINGIDTKFRHPTRSFTLDVWKNKENQEGIGRLSVSEAPLRSNNKAKVGDGIGAVANEVLAASSVNHYRTASLLQLFHQTYHPTRLCTIFTTRPVTNKPQTKSHQTKTTKSRHARGISPLEIRIIPSKSSRFSKIIIKKKEIQHQMGDRCVERDSI